jgi:hypothetical protein
MQKSILTFATALIFAVFLFTHCERFDKKEEIPSYIQIDTLIYQGINPTGFSCAYVYVDYKLVGVFEIPRVIPVLASGDSRITIRPGIDRNGYTYDRTFYELSKGYETRLTLEPSKITTITPTAQDLESVETVWLENFENSAISLMAADTLTPQIRIQRHQRPGHNGFVGTIQINPADTLTEKFDYQYFDSLPIYFQSAPGYFEFSYLCNEPFEVRLKAFVASSSQLQDKTILFVYQSPDRWKRIFIDFSTIVRDLGPNVFYKPYFRIRRLANTNPQDSISVRLDDIRIVYQKR